MRLFFALAIYSSLTEMFRAPTPEDTPTLVAMAEGIAVFKPHELVALREELDDYRAFNRSAGHVSVVCFEEDDPLGFAYYIKVEMTDNTWDRYWIVVSKKTQARGIGPKLLNHVQSDTIPQKGRLPSARTSSLPACEPTRKSYLENGFAIAASVSAYYGDRDDLIIFVKRLISQVE